MGSHEEAYATEGGNWHVETSWRNDVAGGQLGEYLLHGANGLRHRQHGLHIAGPQRERFHGLALPSAG